MSALMVVPCGSVFNVVDDNTDTLVGAFPTASAAAQFIRGGVTPTDTTYQRLMQEAKAEYDAQIQEIENMKAAKILDRVLTLN